MDHQLAELSARFVPLSVPRPPPPPPHLSAAKVKAGVTQPGSDSFQPGNETAIAAADDNTSQ